MNQIGRRDFLKAIGAGAASVILPGCNNGFSLFEGKVSGARANIVLIMADDMGFSDIGCYGSEIATPNLDRLAANGLRFTQFYNNARCCPTRASLMTGLYPHQAGIGHMSSHTGGGGDQLPGYRGVLADRCVTIAEALKPAGYTTLMSGKWHMGEGRPNWPVDRGFDEYFGLLSGGSNYWKLPKRRRMAINDKPYKPEEGKGYYITDAFTDHAVKFIAKYSSSDKPFFLYLAYTAPHWPLHAWPEDIAKYKGKYIKGWDALRAERHKRMIEMGIVDKDWAITPRDKLALIWEELGEEQKEELDLKMAIYAAQIDRMDQGIGRVIESLENNGQLDNTLILFLADNGGCEEGGPYGFDGGFFGKLPKGTLGAVDSYSSYGLSWANASNTPFRRYKHWVHEGGISTPLIAHWPGVVKQKGQLTHQTGHIIDIMATCCDVAGAKYPAKFKGKKIVALEGKSLLPILQDQRRREHKAIYWEHEGNRAVRKGKWKLVSKHPKWDPIPAHSGKWELYDMAADRTELNDLADKHPEIAAELASLYQGWAKRSYVVPWNEVLRKRQERRRQK